MKKDYDYLVVGAGLFGSVFAAEIRAADRSVLVVEKRNHVGGNCYTKRLSGICVHVYGPHVFHTNDEQIWNYVNQLVKFKFFVNRPKVCHGGKFYSFPINLMTLNQVWGVTTPTEAQQKMNEVSVDYGRAPENFEEWLLSSVGRELYQMFYRDYTRKLWGIDPVELPVDFAKRVPIRFNFNDNYYNDRYQGVPFNGYTEMFNKLLLGSQVELGVEYTDELRRLAKTIVYTGRLDEFFNYEFGKLDYRSLHFIEETHEVCDFQGTAVVNYPEENFPFVRITEHKHFCDDVSSVTVVTEEHPANTDGTLCYPVHNEENLSRLVKYKERAKEEENVLFGGRLGMFQYLNMDEVVSSALNAVREERSKS